MCRFHPVEMRLERIGAVDDSDSHPCKDIQSYFFFFPSDIYLHDHRQYGYDDNEDLQDHCLDWDARPVRQP